MMIRAGAVRTVNEATSLRGANILSVRLAAADDRATREVAETTAATIRDASEAAFAVAVDPLAFDADAVSRLTPDYIEFVAADPEKPELLERQFAALAPLGIPLIATGLFLAKDDTGLLERATYLDRLLEGGAALLLIELESLVDPEHRISRSARECLAGLIAQRPALIADAFAALGSPLGLGERGVSLELGVGGGEPRTFTLPAAARLIRGR